ncbi:MAG: DUF2953 domain-containing protein, partial [Clostridia bacterium]|nr:DUF2953 domain-containing protein [Clostridia bacterium]
MTALYIILAILLVLLFLLFLPIRLIFRYDEKITVKLSVLFLPFSLYPRKIREKDYDKRSVNRKKKRLAKKEEKKRQAAQKKGDSAKEKRDVLSALKLLLHILKNIYPRLVRTFHIRVCELDLRIATEDAAKTAILYGAVSQVTAMLLEVCER